MKHFLYDFEDVMAVSDFVLTKKRQNLIFVVVLFFFIGFFKNLELLVHHY